MNKQVTMNGRAPTLKQRKCVSCEDDVHVFEVPDWDARLKTLKLVLSLLPQDRKNRILDMLKLTDTQIAERLAEVVVKTDSNYLRTGSTRKRWLIFRRDKYTCQYCGAKAPDAKLHVDHRVPVSKGGDSQDDNLVTACAKCNQGKGDCL